MGSLGLRTPRKHRATARAASTAKRVIDGLCIGSSILVSGSMILRVVVTPYWRAASSQLTRSSIMQLHEYLPVKYVLKKVLIFTIFQMTYRALACSQGLSVWFTIAQVSDNVT